MRPLKRFYKDVGVAPTQGGGFTVTLDGRPIRTPAQNAISLPVEALARALSEEWAAQEENIDPHSMPLTSMACTAIDLVRQRRVEVVAELAAYGQTEMLCYRAGESGDLADRQTVVWQPLLEWASVELGARLLATPGILPVQQPAEALDALRREVEAHSDMGLAALAAAIKASDSLVLGLALSRGRISAEEAFAAAELEATYQIELWGEDAEATRRRAAIRRDLEAAERFFRILTAEVAGNAR
ncbi:MAG: ATP12 family protein [Rhodovibrionaceae bacterium]|nr:ATP12 family protein [Rhodovibrionaceae bacterium]